MSDMVERVARAIWNSNFHPDDVASGEAERRIADWLSDWEKAERQACAAIAAMQADAAPIDLPAEREAAARAALEAAANLTWKQADDLNNGPPAEYEDHRLFDAGRAHEASCITAAIRAIDPAQFREGGNG